MKLNYIQKITFLISIHLFFLNGKIYSQLSDSTVVPEKKPTLDFSGYIDFNYFKNLNDPRSESNLGSSGAARALDQKENQFQLGLAQTKISYSRQKSDAVIDLTFGPHADLGNYGNVLGPFGKGTTALSIKQAYFNYRFTKKFTFTAGQFGSHVGYEVLDAPLNYNYSLSNAFNNGPFYHLGVKATYIIHPKINVVAGLVNNWDNLYDDNEFKTIIGQLNINPNDKLAIYLNYVGGNESANGSINRNPNLIRDTLNTFKQLLDLTVTGRVNSKFYVGLNALVGDASGKEISATDSTKKINFTHNWGGVTLYSNYQFHKIFGLGVRAEFFDNTSGVMYIGKTDVQSLTVTGRFSLDEDHLLIKPEFRMDVFKKISYSGPDAGNVQQFEDSRGYYTKNSQITVGVAFVYKF